MNSLNDLYGSMKAQDITTQQFSVSTGAASFDCLFSIEDIPFILWLTSRGASPRLFEFRVEEGFWIREFFGDQYAELARVLRTHGRSGKKLMPKEFLEQLNSQIPRNAIAARVPTTKERARLSKGIAEPNKCYFDRWVYWKKGKRSPSAENRTKTLRLIGPEALDYSVDRKASSRWSAVPTGRDWRQHKRRKD